MKYVSVPEDKGYRVLNSCPVILVSTSDGSHPDACAVAWYHPHNFDPFEVVLTISTGHKTWENLKASGVLGINVPTADWAGRVTRLGSVSGREQKDKLAQAGVSVQAGLAIPELPMLAGCAALLECRVTKLDEDEGLVFVKVERCRVAEGALSAEHTWNAVKYPTLHHLGGTEFGIVERSVRID